MSTSELATAYVSATATSVGLAVGLNSSVGRLKSLSPATQTLAKRFVPFVAVVAAGAVNVGLMRYKEVTQGARCALSLTRLDLTRAQAYRSGRPLWKGRRKLLWAIRKLQVASR